jgi:hypothetical protein
MTDESGCLGFDFSKNKTSRHFIVSLLVVSNKKQIDNTVKRVFRALGKAKTRRTNGVLHAYREDDATRFRLLRAIGTKDIGIAIMKLDKHRLVLGGDTHVLYTSMVLKLINQLFLDGHLDTTEAFELIASQADTNRLHRENFVDVVNEGTRALNLQARVAKPADEKGLQAIDFVSWSYWQKYENGITEYADVVAAKVIAEYEYQ